MRIFLSALILLSAFLCQAQHDSPLLYGKYRILPYRLLRPSSPNPDPKPLVVFLHGIGERGKDNVKNTKVISPLFLDSVNRQTYPCYLLIPQCPKGKVWTTSSVVKTVNNLIDSVTNSENVDRNRIYITGLSMGESAL